MHHCGVFAATSSVHTYHEICLASMIHNHDVLLLRIWLLCWRFGLWGRNQAWTQRLQLDTKNKMWTLKGVRLLLNATAILVDLLFDSMSKTFVTTL